MKNDSIFALIGILLFAIGAVFVLAKDEPSKKKSYFDCVVEFSNGDRDTVTCYSFKPFVNDNGCMYDGDTYTCSIRRVISYTKR